MSERITLSPTCNPDTTSTAFTETRPSFTLTRVASLPSGVNLKIPMVLSACPCTGRPTYITSLRFSMVMVPSTLKSGRAPGGRGPSRLMSTATVPFTGAAAMRVTWPSTIPFLVSMEAFCPGTTSFAWVSAIWICPFSNFGSETRARFVPGVTCWPTSTATACNTPLMPARTCSASSWLLRRLYRAFCWSTRALRVQARLRRVTGNPRAFFFELDANGELFRSYFRKFRGHLGRQPLLEKLVVHLSLQLGLLVIAADRALVRFLAGQLAVHLNSQVRVI